MYMQVFKAFFLPYDNDEALFRSGVEETQSLHYSNYRRKWNTYLGVKSVTGCYATLVKNNS